MLIVSQVFWVDFVVGLGERFIPGKPRRAWLTAIATVICLFLFAYNILPYVSPLEIPRGDSTHLMLRHVLRWRSDTESASVREPLHAAFLITIEDLIAGLAGDAKLPAKFRHRLAG
jgi:hypothetical protein